ncbi:hypothetical protein GQ457_10G009220 [Hibiscus cannabinus]
MFDLAINTTLESIPSRPNPSLVCRLPLAQVLGLCDFSSFREGVSELCSFVYSGGLSRDLSEFIVEIQDPNKSFQKEIKIVIFLRFMHIAFSLVNRKRRSSFRCLTICSRRFGDQLVREFVST